MQKTNIQARRTIETKVRLNKEEINQINNNAKIMRMSRAKYMRICALNKKINPPDQNMINLIRELSMIGSNVNQIAKRFNQSKFINFLSLKKILEEVSNKLDNVRTILLK